MLKDNFFDSDMTAINYNIKVVLKTTCLRVGTFLGLENHVHLLL